MLMFIFQSMKPSILIKQLMANILWTFRSHFQNEVFLTEPAIGEWLFTFHLNSKQFNAANIPFNFPQIVKR